MTTLLAAAEARHQLAIATLEAAEAELLAAMRAVEPDFNGDVTAMSNRRWESRLEGKRPLWELAQAHSAWRRAVRAKAKARSAAHRARWADAPRTAPLQREPAGMTAAEVLAGLRELRGERVAA